MLCTVNSATTYGLDGVLIKVEVDVADRGFPTFIIVGLPNKAIDESKERIRTAIKNTLFPMPETRIVVNLAPADIPKEGSLFDLPITIGILAASNIIKKNDLASCLFIGEISLEGKIRPVPGVLPIILMAKEKGIKTVFLPHANQNEAMLVSDITIYAVDDLSKVILHLNEELQIDAFVPPKNLPNDEKVYPYDFAYINGQNQAKRALEIAASGFHNIHLKGPPGSGKSLLAQTFPSILPPMTREEIIDVTKIYSISEVLKNSSIITHRPFRAPHHTTSRVGLIGGGTKLTPGEISLAHRGVLFLDEFSEFPRSVLESLRQPLEDGKIVLSRALGSVIFPARFILLAASNPCECGFLGHPKKTCTCSLWQIIKYKKRISGPILDRIDLHIDVPPIENEVLVQNIKGEESKTIRGRVIKAQQIQKKRFQSLPILMNGEMTSQMVKELCKIDEKALMLLKQAVSKLSLSGRSYFKIIKVAQTIADLAGEETIKDTFVAEALQYRVSEE